MRDFAKANGEPRQFEAVDEDLDSQSARELIEDGREFFRHNVISRYGDEILNLSQDDERLLAHMESGQPELLRRALDCMVHIHLFVHPRIVEICGDYMEFGAHSKIRNLCILYFCEMLTHRAGERVRGILNGCAERLRRSPMTKEDEYVVKYIEMAVLIGTD
jgi:hypothetical protein